MNLFVISTPSQAFFLSKMPILLEGQNILLITENKKGVAKKITRILQNFHWKKILIIDIIGIESKFNFYKIFLFFLKFKLFNINKALISKVFIGSYDNLFHLGIVAKFEKVSEIFLLYDGLQMVAVANSRRDSNKNGIRSYSSVFKLAGFQKPRIKKLTYTSPINLVLPPQDGLIKMEPIEFKKPVLTKDLIYFVGQPLVDTGIVGREFFLSKLRKLKKNFSTSSIYYVPHPKESEGILTEIATIFKIKNFNRIFEEVYITTDIFAETIISFYSSALINMYYLKGDVKIYSIRIQKENVILPPFKDSIENIYLFFEENADESFQVLYL